MRRGRRHGIGVGAVKGADNYLDTIDYECKMAVAQAVAWEPGPRR